MLHAIALFHRPIARSARRPRGLLLAALVGALGLPALAQATPYVDAAGNALNSPVTATPLSGGGGTLLNSGWYISNCSVTNPAVYTGSLSVNGNVNLILADGCALTVNGNSGTAGIEVTPGNSLTVWAQSAGAAMGSLTANGSIGGAGIGGDGGLYGQPGGAGGNITIEGGAVTANGSNGGAGIGGGAGGNGGYQPGGAGGRIVIDGGVVTATGGGGVYGGGSGGGAGLGGGGGGTGCDGKGGASGDVVIGPAAQVSATGGGGSDVSGGAGGGAGIGSGGGACDDASGGSLGTISLAPAAAVAAAGGGGGLSSDPGYGDGGNGADTGVGGRGGTVGPTNGSNGAAAVWHSVTVSAGAGGSVAPAGSAWSVNDGGSPAFTFAPDSGYAIDTLTLDGADVKGALAGNVYTLSNVTADHTLEATFRALPPAATAAPVPALSDWALALLALLLAGGAMARRER